ncbi:MAG: hypothetical protein HOH43_17245 [Candidatus Latescibacteria bacterium]|jgi:hypothetical protein|nr:hypothetical protein [Candidatus Latescibacterota bacterium]
MKTRTYKPADRQYRRGQDAKHDGMRGFAMMDVAFGAAILGIVVMGTLQIFSFGQRQITTRIQERSAYDLARMRVEEVIAQGITTAVARTDSNLTVTGEMPATRVTTITWIDDPADSTGAGDMDGPNDFKEVVVNINYGPDGATKTVTLTTVLVP